MPWSSASECCSGPRWRRANANLLGELPKGDATIKEAARAGGGGGLCTSPKRARSFSNVHPTKSTRTSRMTTEYFLRFQTSKFATVYRAFP
jgi:hypothetical protein